MEIKKLDLKWTGVLQPLFINSIKHIILHHTAHPTWNVMDVHNYHQRSNNWIGIGYNFFIQKDGTIYIPEVLRPYLGGMEKIEK